MVGPETFHKSFLLVLMIRGNISKQRTEETSVQMNTAELFQLSVL